MRCKDGTYLSGGPAADRCAGNGGVASIFSARPPLVPAKPQPQRKQP
ncbi:MAG: hypothetical protein ACHQSE_10075 [Gemmatimonadales bacterium]